MDLEELKRSNAVLEGWLMILIALFSLGFGFYVFLSEPEYRVNASLMTFLVGAGLFLIVALDYRKRVAEKIKKKAIPTKGIFWLLWYVGYTKLSLKDLVIVIVGIYLIVFGVFSIFQLEMTAKSSEGIITIFTVFIGLFMILMEGYMYIQNRIARAHREESN